ncbi:MAG: hypothetical protein PHQ67_00950 [Fermentimonas sp.]|nr:hypothetical protein [Fermentimonas sp.]MDD4008359.1 hypothetical protein [Fermentimonas sp.]MDD4696440.1 hypothetical protein [Fermentimonas sp.]
MKKLLITITTCCLITLSVSAQTKSGILFGGSPWGKVNTKFSAEMQAELTRYEISYKSNMMLGYRFRIPHYDIPAFMDIDAMIGLNNWNSAYKEKSYTPEPGNGPQYDILYNYSAQSNYFYGAVAVTANYTLFNNFSAGLGIAPTYWFSTAGEESSKKIDIPLAAKIGYDLKYFELGLTYKHGLMNSIKTYYIQSGNFRDVQLSIWIPF